MKLVVIIPALNESATIADIVRRVPRDIPTIDEVEVVVVDDGSTDETPHLASEAGATVISHQENKGVGQSFATGLNHALGANADYLVNIDGDGQFKPEDMRELLQPLIDGTSEFATASRFKDPKLYPKMSTVKFYGNRMMSMLISSLCGKKFYDVSCGYRAYSREAMLNLNLFGKFTYTQETFLDLSFKGIRIVEVPIEVRGTREHGKSRVASNLFAYAYRTSNIIFRTYRDYRPLLFFGSIAGVLFLLALGLCAFLLPHYLRTGSISPHKWAGFTAGFFASLGALVFIAGLLADMLVRIRLNQERLLYFDKRDRAEQQKRDAKQGNGNLEEVVHDEAEES